MNTCQRHEKEISGGGGRQESPQALPDCTGATHRNRARCLRYQCASPPASICQSERGELRTLVRLPRGPTAYPAPTCLQIDHDRPQQSGSDSVAGNGSGGGGGGGGGSGSGSEIVESTSNSLGHSQAWTLTASKCSSTPR